MAGIKKDNPRTERRTFLFTRAQAETLALASKRLKVSEAEIVRHATFEVYLSKVISKLKPAPAVPT